MADKTVEFFEHLQGLMSKKGMTQADIVRATGISRSLVSDYVNGNKSPALSNAISLAAALGVTLDELSGRPVSEPVEVVHSVDLSPDALEVAKAYDKLDEVAKAVVRRAVCLPEPIQKGKTASA